MDSARKTVVVPPAGLGEKFVREGLGVSVEQVRALMGAELGAPRDYSMPVWATAAIFTPTGVRNLAALLGIDAEVLAEGEQPAPPPPEPHHHERPERRAQDAYQTDPDEETS